LSWRSKEVLDFGLNQEPGKNALLGKTLVPFGHVRPHLKGLGTRIVLSLELMLICTSGELSYPVKVPEFLYTV
jgi:hypothetical protein